MTTGRGGRFRILAASAAIILLALAATVLFVGRGHEFGFWQALGAQTGVRQDLGPVNFATLTRRPTPTDALACPKEACPKAASDVAPPTFTVPAERVLARLRRVALNEAGVSEIQPGGDELRLRFLQRSDLLGRPEIVDVMAIARSSGASTLAIYSRSVWGKSDDGANRARLERWLAKLAQ